MISDLERRRRFLQRGGGALLVALLLALGASAHAPHQVRIGETLGSIAREHLGTSARWREIALLNRVTSPHHLPPGIWLRLPGDTPERRFTDLAGPVEYRPAAATDWRPLRAELRATEAMEIRTGPGGRVTIRTEREGVLAIREKSEVYLPAPGRTDRRIVVRGGSLSAEVDRQARGREFMIATPVSVAGVRGTRFLVAHAADDGRTSLSVWEGGVAHTAAEVTVLVPGGQGSSARAGEPPSAPVPLPPPPTLLAPAANQTLEEATITFTWAAVANAASYRLEVAREARFASLLVAQLVPAAAGSRISATLPRLPVVELHWRVAARTAEQLEGQPSPGRRLNLAHPRDILRRLYRERRFQEVIRFVDRMDSPAREQRILRASALYRLSMIAAAEEAFRQLEREVPDDYEVALGLAWCAYRSERDDEAEWRFREILNRHSGDAEALAGLGYLRYRAERWEEAVDYLERSYAANPDNSEVADYLADARRRRNQ